MDIESLSWEDVHAQLLSGRLSPEERAAAIVRMGKPFIPDRIQKAKAAVAQFLEDPSDLVRHEALWFLGCWGKLSEFLPQIARQMTADPFVDNRAFAARCIGQMTCGNRNPRIADELLAVVVSESEEESVRSSAYGSLLLMAQGKSASHLADEFQIWHTKGISDIDWNWIRALRQRDATQRH